MIINNNVDGSIATLSRKDLLAADRFSELDIDHLSTAECSQAFEYSLINTGGNKMHASVGKKKEGSTSVRRPKMPCMLVPAVAIIFELKAAILIMRWRTTGSAFSVNRNALFRTENDISSAKPWVPTTARKPPSCLLVVRRRTLTNKQRIGGPIGDIT